MQIWRLYKLVNFLLSLCPETIATMKQTLLSAVTVTPRLPLNYEEAKDFCADGLSYETRETFWQEFRNVFLISTGILYTPNKMLPESAIHTREDFLSRHPATYPFLQKAKDFLKGKVKRLSSKEKYLTLFDEWTSNHYHLHVELLPRLLFFSQEELAHITLILPDTDYIRKSAPSVLRQFGFHFRRILYMKHGEIYFIPRCLFVSKPVVPGFAHPGQLTQLKARLRVRVKASEGSPKLIYVQRKHTLVRGVLNEPEVVETLQGYGFKPLDFGDYTIEEQAKLAAGAEVMIGIHGAGLTNLLYMDEGSKLIEFRREGTHHNHCYWHLAAAVGINYAVVFGTPDDPDKQLEGAGCSLTIDLAALRKEVERVL